MQAVRLRAGSGSIGALWVILRVNLVFTADRCRPKLQHGVAPPWNQLRCVVQALKEKHVTITISRPVGLIAALTIVFPCAGLIMRRLRSAS